MFKVNSAKEEQRFTLARLRIRISHFILLDAPTVEGIYRYSGSVLIRSSFSSSALKMASVLQKLFHPLFSGPPEPPRNKVTVVGVGQVGMACAVTILLRVRVPAFTFAQINPLPAAAAALAGWR